MVEKTVSLSCVAAIGLWVLTFVLILAGTVTALVDHQEHMAAVIALMAHGLVCAVAAGTVSVRLMIRQQNGQLRNAFELGRDSRGGPVRSMR